MRLRDRLLLVLSAAALLAAAGCGDDAPSADEQREAKSLLKAAVDAIGRERRAGFEAHLRLRLVPREQPERGADVSANVEGSYEAGGRYVLSGSWNLFGREFDGRLLSDPDRGIFAYDSSSRRWYGEERRSARSPEAGVREFLSDVLLSGYPASLADRRAFGESLGPMAKRVIDVYGERVVELYLEDGKALDGTATQLVRMDPKPEAIVRIVRRRGTRGRGIEEAIEKLVREIEPRLLLGESDHLPRELSLDFTVDDLDLAGSIAFERIEGELSLSLSDWGKEFDITPPARFRPLYELSAFAPD
jgi:hypothetical protein